MNGWGNTGRKIVDKHRKILKENKYALDDPEAESVLGESLTMFGLTYLAQDSQTRRLCDQLMGASEVSYHMLGVCGQNNTPYIDVPLSLCHITSHDLDEDTLMASWFSGTGHGSVYESGIIEQLQFPLEAVSTVKLLDLANESGYRVYHATNDNWNTIQNELTGYDETEILNIGNYTTQGFTIILPKEGSLTKEGWNWAGHGYLGISDSTLFYSIKGGLSGGYAVEEDWTFQDPDFYTIPDPVSVDSYDNVQANDPIDLVTGSYTYNHSDLTIGTGGWPFSLDFKRYYSSGSRLEDGPLGLGWTHNFDITAEAHSDGFQSLGADSPIDAAPAIVEMYINKDILSIDRGIRNVMMATMCQKWLMDQMTQNVVIVKQPGNTMQFVKLPNGSYNPPPGKTGTLTETSGEYSLKTKTGNVLDFDTEGLIDMWSDPQGNEVEFQYEIYNDYYVSADMVSHWKLDHYGSGYIAYDLVGNNNGVLGSSSRAPTWTNGKIGSGALSFDEDHNDYVMIGDESSLESDEFTLSLWAKLILETGNDPPNYSYQGGVGKGGLFDIGSYVSYSLYFSSNKAGYRITNNNGYSFPLPTANKVPIGNEDWHMWTMTVGNGEIYFYKDGRMIEAAYRTYSGDIIKNSTTFRIGATSDNKSFHGLVDDVIYYKKVLSEEEVRDLYLEKNKYRLTTVTNDFGRSLTLSYNNNNCIDTVTDSASPSRDVTYGYDNKGNLKTFSDADDKITTFTYDPTKDGQLISIYYPANNPGGTTTNPFVTNEYDSLGRVKTQTNANNYEAHPNDDNYKFHYYYSYYRSEELEPAQTEYPAGTPNKRFSTIYYFDDNGNMIAKEDQLGNKTTYQLDGQHRNTLVTYPEGNATRYLYDDNHNANKIIQIADTASFSGAFAFDGGGYVRVSDFSELNGSSGATIAFAARQYTNEVKDYVLWAEGNVLIEFGSSETGVTTDLRIRWHLDGDWRNEHTAPGVLDTGTWHHWAFTFDQGTTKIYKDGEEIFTDSDSQTSISTVSPHYDFGYRNDVGGFNGTIDNVMIFNKALSSDEIGELWSGGSGTESIPAGLAGNCKSHWKMNESAASRYVADSSGNANHGKAQKNTYYMAVPGHTETTITQSLVYDTDPAGFNNLLSSTDPRGYVTTYEYYDIGTDEEGLLKKVIEPEVDGQSPQTYYTYNDYGQLDLVVDAEGLVTKNIYFADTQGAGLRKKIVSVNGSVGRWKMDEGTGNQISDNSGYANHGTISGATWVAGYGGSGSALSFDGDGSDYVDCGYDNILDLTTPFTYTAWVKLTAGSSTARMILSQFDSLEKRRELNVNNSNKLVFRLGTGDSHVAVVSSNTLAIDGTWSHVAGVYDGSELHLYINGNLDELNSPEISTVASTGTARLYIGSRNEAGIFMDNGVIDDVRIFYRALPEEDIKALYNGQLLNVLNIATEFTYDTVGNVKEGKGPRGYVTTFDYDDMRRLKKSTAPAPFNYETRYEYYADGNLKLQQSATGDGSEPWHEIGYTYTLSGKVDEITNPNSKKTKHLYDSLDRLWKVTDVENHVTEQLYYPNGQPWKIVDAETNDSALYTYYNDGQVQSVTDAEGNTTWYNYDGFRRFIETRYPTMNNERLSYDDAGNVTRKETRSGEDIFYEYDELNRLKSKTLPVPGAANVTYEYAYDLVGRATEISQVGISDPPLSYGLDDVGRVKNVTYSDGKTVSYEYDSASNRTKLTYPDSTYVTYEYDELNRLKKILDQGSSDIVEYGYDALSRRTSTSYANSTSAAYIYGTASQETAGRLMSLNNTTNSGNHNFAYTYYDMGNKDTMTVNGSDVHTYTYDDIYQLRTVQYPSGFFVPNTIFNYDAVGNRDSVDAGGTTDYVPNELNQYDLVGGVHYGYDDSGNLTNNGVNYYMYDAQNRLLTANAPGYPQITYTYDPLGRRTVKNVDGVVTKYLYDGNQVICEYDNYDRLTRKFLYGAGIDEPVRMLIVQQVTDITGDGWIDIHDIHAMAATWLRQAGDIDFNGAADLNRDNAINNMDSDILSANFNSAGSSVVIIYYYHFDGSSNVIALSDSSGNTVETYAYDVFGRVDTTGSAGNPYFFTGRRFDTETGLYYYRARYYDPAIGRFLQPDPIGYDDGMNMYTYCSNNPIIFVDPSGLCSSFTYSDNPWADFGLMVAQEFATDINNAIANIVNAPGDYYNAFRASGMGPITSGISAANMTVGKVVGYSTLGEGIMGLDVRSVRETQGWERTGQVAIGTAQTALSAVAIASAVSKVKAGPSTMDPYKLEPIQPRMYDSNKMRKFVNEIANNGIKKPINYYREGGINYVADGHHRLLAAKELGLPSVPVNKIN